MQAQCIDLICRIYHHTRLGEWKLNCRMMMRQNVLLLFLVTQLLLPNQIAGMRRTFPSSWLLYYGYSSGSSQQSSSIPDSEESSLAPRPTLTTSRPTTSPPTVRQQQILADGGVTYSAWRKLDNGTYIRVNDSLRAQDLWYASSPSSVNSSTLDAMDVIEIENGRWVFSEERGKWHWEPKAGQVCFLHNYFQQFRNHFEAIFWMLQFIFFRVKQLFLEVGRCCRTGSGFSIRPPRRPTLRRARRVGNLEVMALGIIKCQ